MIFFLLGLSAAAASDPATTAAATCASAATCGSCAELLDHGCFWCYDDGSCKALDDPITSGGHMLHGCQAFSFAAPDCACQQYKTCAECATPQNAVCEWTNTTTNITVDGPGGFHSAFTIGHRASCRDAGATGPASGPATIISNATLGPLTIAIVETPTAWWWAQCSIQGPAAVIGVAAAGLVALLVLCCAARCLCRRLCCRRRRQAALLDDRLLSVQAVNPSR